MRTKSELQPERTFVYSRLFYSAIGIFMSAIEEAEANKFMNKLISPAKLIRRLREVDSNQKPQTFCFAETSKA